MIIVVACIFLTSPVFAVRVSPKLDFGDSNVKSEIRPITDTRYVRGSDVTKSYYQTAPTKIENIGIVCTSNKCNAGEAVSGNNKGVSTDVVVHVKTNVDVAKANNGTVENVPDVPIVVGTKTSTTPTISNSLNPSYPSTNILPPLSTNNGFVPSIGPSYIPSPQLQTDSQVLGNPNLATYAPRFQDDTNNVIDFKSIYFRPPSNRGVNYRPISPWQPNSVRGNGYNPVEFRKTYSNTWSTNFNRDNPTVTRIGGAIPRWTPCVCENSNVHRYPTTTEYSSSSDPAGINGKLASLA